MLGHARAVLITSPAATPATPSRLESASGYQRAYGHEVEPERANIHDHLVYLPLRILQLGCDLATTTRRDKPAPTTSLMCPRPPGFPGKPRHKKEMPQQPSRQHHHHTKHNLETKSLKVQAQQDQQQYDEHETWSNEPMQQRDLTTAKLIGTTSTCQHTSGSYAQAPTQ